jgi:hypothetical protein
MLSMLIQIGSRVSNLILGAFAMVQQRKTKSRNPVVKAAELLNKARTGIVITGRVKDGKVEIDQASLNAAARKFGKANISFVAVNAPFDPKGVAQCS